MVVLVRGLGGGGLRGTRDADCHVASLLAMTVRNLCHSEEACRADVGIRSLPCGGRGFGPSGTPAPTGGCGRLPRVPGVAGAQRSVCGGGGEE